MQIISTPNAAPAGFTKRANGNIMDCNRQWASRPADEAVYTVDELLSRTEATRTGAREVENVDWSTLKVLADGDRLALTRGGSVVDFTHYALQQFCGLPTPDGGLAPLAFVSKLQTDTAALVLNERLGQGVSRTNAAKMLVQGGKLRCVTTDAYERIWDVELAQRVERLCERGTWQPAEAFKRAGDQSVAHAWGERSRLPLGWVGDRSMFVCLVDYEGSVIHEGNEYARFLLLSNSQVGAAPLKVVFGLMDFACCNFILWGCHEVYEASFRHTKSIHDRWNELSKGFTKQLSSDSRAEILSGISAARRTLIGDTKDEVLAVTRAATDLPAALVVDAYNRAEATPRYGDSRSVWGMLNGLTEASQHATEYADKRTAIDAKAARLMGLLKR